MLVQERARRATAGNRMRDLLEQALESDELFVEAENDVDFEAREGACSALTAEEPDYVDSDFDGNSSEEDSGEDQEAEALIEREEKRQSKAVRRPAVRSLAVSVAPAPRRERRPAAAVPRPSGDGAVRSSSRRATVESKLATQSKLQEAEARRASAKARPAKRAKQLTQDALIREALEIEETNTESLLHFLEREEERKVRQRQSNKKEIQGPFVRWISVGLPQNIWAVRAHEHGADTKNQDAVPKAEQGPSTHEPGGGPSGAPSSELPAGTTLPAAGALPTPEAPPAGEVAPATEVAPTTEAPPSTEALPTPKALPAGEAPPAASTLPAAEASPAPEMPPQAAENNAPVAPADPQEASPAVAPVAASADPMTTAVAAPPTLVESAPTDTHSTEDSGAVPLGLAEDVVPEETTARTILTLQNLEPSTTWVDEFRLLLGDHCAWDRLPIVPSRNRPFRPRQSLCVITGLPARYRDPHTGLPYATTHAYAMLRRVLNGEFSWTGSPHRATALAAGCFGSALTDCGAGHVFS